MTTKTRILWALAASAAVAIGAVATAGADRSGGAGVDGPADVVIRAVDVVDVRHGVVRADQDIVVRGTTIAAIAPAGAVLPPAKTVIDGRGKFAMPGLIEVQAQLAAFSRETVAVLLADGITAVRDVGTDPVRIAEWRRALAYGQMYAPRIARACAAPTAAGAAGRQPAEPGCDDTAAGTGAAFAALMRARQSRASSGAVLSSASLHEALEWLAAGGFTPADALRAATVDAARVLALPDLGELVVSYGADIVVTTANPLRDIRNARAIDAVVFRGEALTQAHLNRLRAGHMPKTSAAVPR